MNYQYVELGGDVSFIARGKDLKELFRQAAIAMYNVMVDVEKVDKVEEVEVELRSPDLSLLLHDWLSELLFITDTKRLVFSDFSVNITKEGSEYLLRGKAFGEKLNMSKHDPKTEIKAVTYHSLKIQRSGDLWEGTVVLDL
ncbi:MAG TPA: archease [Candidatus Korarchaeota archaeon]|nr:MAG: archease [Candidatus Korarchaeota archaeon]HDD69370.1 archease [Candidatus Korarchaeota archaeon]